MGGKLFSERRISSEELEIIRSDVFSKFKGSEEMSVPRTFSNKKDHGDLDICLYDPNTSREFLRENFNITDDEISINDSVVSFKYKDFQIDLCHYPLHELHSALNYMAFGDLSNMIGVIANKAFGMRYTHRGLVCPIKLKQEDVLGDVVISTNIVKILEFFDLDFDKWLTGFSDEVEAFDWITKSKYFNKDFFAFEALNHQNRTRNRKRAMYSRFIEWVEDEGFENNYTPPENKAEHIWRSCVHFEFNWTHRADSLLNDRIDLNVANEKWNANDIIRLTGLKNKELGDCIKSFKDYVLKIESYRLVDKMGYMCYILHNSKIHIEQVFNEWYNKEYKKL